MSVLHRIVVLLLSSAICMSCGGGNSAPISPVTDPPVKVNLSNASLSGGYALVFIASGFYLAGSFQADGQGNITNGVEDLNDFTGLFNTNRGFAGTYTVEPDGAGTAKVASSLGTSTFDFVLDGSGGGSIIAVNGDHGTGFVAQQDPSAFSLSSLSGDWAFSFAGMGSTGGTATAAGRFSMDGQGNITAGTEDHNEAGTINANAGFTGTFASPSTTDGNGAATFSCAALGTSHFAYYVVSRNKMLFLSLDPSEPLVGSADKQQATTFSGSSLNGDYTFFLTGSSTSGFIVEAGRLTGDGNGSITSAAFGENDPQNAGFAGSYTISANGRGTATVTSPRGTSAFAFYMVSPSEAVFVEADAGGNVASGSLALLQGAPFLTSSAAGSYVFLLAGAHLCSPLQPQEATTANWHWRGRCCAASGRTLRPGFSMRPVRQQLEVIETGHRPEVPLRPATLHDFLPIFANRDIPKNRAR